MPALPRSSGRSKHNGFSDLHLRAIIFVNWSVPLFSWFDAGVAKEFGSEMARLYIKHMPLNSGLSEKKFAIKSKQMLEKMDRQVASFKHQNKLNTYKIAQLGNTFKWALKDAGYEEAYVDELTQWLVARVR